MKPHWITAIFVCLLHRSSSAQDSPRVTAEPGGHQQNVTTSALDCQSSLLPYVANGFLIQISDGEVVVYCDAGMVLLDGSSHASLECVGGQWSATEDDLLCQQDCEEDDGQCAPPSTFCHPDLYEDYVISFGTVTSCPPGYTVTSPSTPLECRDEAWTPQDHCAPQCDGDCGGYGTCVAPNTCLCDNKRVMETCSGADQGGLVSLMVAECGALQHSATVDQTTREIKLQCPASYQFVDGISGDSATIVCAQGSWTTVGTQQGISDMVCEPACDRNCLNGGSCGPSARCVCTSGFFGAECELRRCEPLPVLPNAVIIASTDRSSATVQCNPGYQVPGSPASRVRVACDDSHWVVPPLLRWGCEPVTAAPCGELELPPFVELVERSPAALQLQCHPQSSLLGPSLGALCVEGEWLGQEGNLNLRVLTLDQWRGLCEPKGACPRNPEFVKHMNFTVAEHTGSSTGASLGLVTCSPGYAFPGGVTTFHATCSHQTAYQWRVPATATSPGLGGQYLNRPNDDLFTPVPPCEPVCSPPCLNGATCLSPGHCLCPSGLRGPQCDEPCEEEAPGCLNPPPLQEHADLYYNGSLAVVECQAGYELHTGLTHYHLTCQQERWTPANTHGGVAREEFPSCRPVCQFPCLNGGWCHRPNTCWCPSHFRGTYCQVPQQQNCPTDPHPAPNAIIHVTEAGRVLRCGPGYSLRGGLTEAAVWCREGRWVFPRALYEDQQEGEYRGPLTVDMESMAVPSSPGRGEPSFSPCQPVCDPPCINRGVCVAPGECRCPPPFLGERCTTPDPALCWATPPVIQNSSIMYSPSSGSLLCEDGYSLFSGAQSVLLSCRAGVWQAQPDTPIAATAIEDPAAPSWLDGCHPSCHRPCLNGGTCVAPDTCRCAHGFVGRVCETRAPRTCRTLVRAKDRADIIISPSSSVLHCHQGYSLASHQAQATLQCRDGEWVAEVSGRLLLAADMDCLPVCPGGCSNGGTCQAPGQCQCPPGYAGADCSVRTCEVPPQLVTSAIWQYDPQSQVLEVQCREGRRLQSGNITTTLYCEHGAWRAAGGEEQVECLPSCHPPCLNGGRCVDPSTCTCPQGFTGTTCNKRYSLTVDGTRCVFPFYHRGRLHHSCTSHYNYTYNTAPNTDDPLSSSFHITPACSGDEGVSCTVPWCPTAVDSDKVPVQWGACAGIVGAAVAQVTVGGERCVFPFTYEAQQYHRCTSAGGRPQEWCAVEVDESGGATRWDYCQQDYGLETVTLTYQGSECHFPFRYEGQWYDDCLSRFTFGGSWCATDVTAAGDLLTKGSCIVHWGHYQDYLTRGRRLCSAPFLMGGNTRWGCQGEQPWCPVQLTEDLTVEKWSFCDPPEEWPGVSVSLPSAIGAPEVRVFTVTGERCLEGGVLGVDGCVGDGALEGMPWCPLARDGLGAITRKGVCYPAWHLSFVPPWLRSFVDSGPKDPLIRHTTQGVRCVLPFRYKGRTFLDCAPHKDQSEQENDFPRSWCAVTVETNLEVETWDHCKDNIYSVQYTGPKVLSLVQNIVTRDQQLCVFPFHHEGAVYFSCVADNSTVNSHGWCATSVTANGGVGRRGDCPLLATQLTDAAKVIQQCKDDGESLIFPAGPAMGGGVAPLPPTSGPRCVVPFVYRNVTYWDCTDAGEGAPWCAVEVDDRRRVLKKEDCLPGWYLQPTDQIKEVAWQRDWILDMRGAVLRAGTLSGVDEDWQRVVTLTGKACVFPSLLPGNSAPQRGCVCPPTGCGDRGPVCATRVDAGGRALETEPCRGLLIRKEDFFERLMSH